MFTFRPTETKKKPVFIFRTIEWGQLYISMYGYSFLGGFVYHEFVNFSYNL